MLARQIATVAAFIWLFSILVSLAHDAPASRKQPYGWTYDTACCNAYDCRQLDPDEIEETASGEYVWRSKHSGVTHIYTLDERMDSLSYGRKVRRSQDEFFHGCESNSSPVRKLCLYVPDKAG